MKEMPESKTCFFVRHGETPLHVNANRFCGDLDPPLTARGRDEAERARETLARIMPNVDAAWVSPRRRAQETAHILRASAKWEIIEDLRELSFGAWEGLTKEEARAQTPEAYAAWERDAYLNAPPGGESGRAALPRIERVLEMIDRAQAENILVVSHTTYLRLLLSLLLNIPPDEARKRLEIQTGGIGIIEIAARKGKLKALNL